MKKVFLLLLLPFAFSSFSKMQSGITDAEKKFAVDNLRQTQSDLIASVKGLSDAQLNFKTAPDRWSILECVDHIVLASQGIWQMQQGTMKQANDSGWKSTVTDDMFIKMVEDRSHKAQAAEPFKPVHATYRTIDEALAAFNADREKLVAYVQTSGDDMRAHFTKMPFGVIDDYQVVLLISAHTNRHKQQIDEVKADPNFPKQ